jgi:hypothetical protein
MDVTTTQHGFRYEQHGWRLDVYSGELGNLFTLVPTLTGGMEFSSGANLDQLAAFLADAKAHALNAGINWSGN